MSPWGGRGVSWAYAEVDTHTYTHAHSHSHRVYRSNNNNNSSRCQSPSASCCCLLACLLLLLLDPIAAQPTPASHDQAHNSKATKTSISEHPTSSSSMPESDPALEWRHQCCGSFDRRVSSLVMVARQHRPRTNPSDRRSSSPSCGAEFLSCGAPVYFSWFGSSLSYGVELTSSVDALPLKLDVIDV